VAVPFTASSRKAPAAVEAPIVPKSTALLCAMLSWLTLKVTKASDTSLATRLRLNVGLCFMVKICELHIVNKVFTVASFYDKAMNFEIFISNVVTLLKYDSVKLIVFIGSTCSKSNYYPS
jgi:hypothetical protein